MSGYIKFVFTFELQYDIRMFKLDFYVYRGMADSKITIIKRDLPKSDNINDLLQWYGASLGLFSLRDKNSSCFRIFIVLLHDLKRGHEGYTSDDIAERTNLSRGTVVHHLNKLQQKNLVVSAENTYFLHVENLEQMTEDVREELNEMLDDLRKVGERIDTILNL